MEDEIKFTIFDKDTFKSEVICEVALKVGILCSLQEKRRWLTMWFQGRKAGDLLLEAKYTPP